MMKKRYHTPSMEVVKIPGETRICEQSLSSVRRIDGNASMKYGGSGNGAARARERRTIWDTDFE